MIRHRANITETERMMKKISKAKLKMSFSLIIRVIKCGGDTVTIANIQATIAIFFVKLLVTITLWSIHFRMAMYLSHAIIVR